MEPFGELHAPVYIPHDDAQGREANGGRQDPGIRDRSRGLEEIEPEYHKDAHGDELYCNANEHDVGAGIGAFGRDFVSRARGEAATCALYGDGDDVEGAEDDEVETGGDETKAASVLSDESAQNVVKAGGEEAGCFVQC